MTHIEAARTEWAYEQMAENYRANRNVWVEVADAFRDDALGCVPPIYRTGGFLVGEAYTHTRQGLPVFAGFATIGTRHFAAYATPSDFERGVVELRHAVAVSPVLEG